LKPGRGAIINEEEKSIFEFFNLDVTFGTGIDTDDPSKQAQEIKDLDDEDTMWEWVSHGRRPDFLMTETAKT
jgi:hypothetical protein